LVVVRLPAAARLRPKLSAVAPAGTAEVVQAARVPAAEAAKAGLSVQYCQVPLEFW
jgi:hypothetical protein